MGSRMEKLTGYSAVAAASALLALAVSSGVAQHASLDPTVIAPDAFKVALENDLVRVVRVTVEDGNGSAPHAHPHRVVVFVNDCVWLDTAEDGSTIEEPFAAGDVSWQEAVIHDGSPNHVRDTCELLEIELK